MIGGKWRSRRLNFDAAEGLRPTTDRTRETLFNWIAPFTLNAHCLDVFSGSGALGLEALSRGADKVVFLEANRHAAQSIQQNLQILNAENGTVVNTEAIKWLNATPPTPFNIIFLDPPFHQQLLTPSFQLLTEKGWLEKEALIYVEREKELANINVPESWQIQKEKQAGQVLFQLYRLVEQDKK